MKRLLALAALSGLALLGTELPASAAGGFPVQNEPVLCTMTMHQHSDGSHATVTGSGTCTGLLQLRT